MSRERVVQWTSHYGPVFTALGSIFTALGSIAAATALLGLFLTWDSQRQQTVLIQREQQEKQPIFHVAAVADDRGRPVKLVVEKDGATRDEPTVHTYGNLLVGRLSAQVERGDVVTQVCACDPSVVIPISFWDRMKHAGAALVAVPATTAVSLDEVASIWRHATGQQGTIGLVTHVVIDYTDVQGEKQHVGFSIGRASSENAVEPPTSLLQLTGRQRLLPASSEPPSVVTECGRPSLYSLLFGPSWREFKSSRPSGLAAQLRNVVDAIRQGPDNATKLTSCA